jgi:hypothetical protein
VTDKETIIVRKNRQRAFWALIIVVFMTGVSLVLLITGLLADSTGILWTPVMMGVVGLVSFGAAAIAVLRTIRSPWHLAISPSHLTLYTPTYLLEVPWEDIASIAVDEVNYRLGCSLVFEDVASVVERARFHARSSRPDVVSDATTMLARMRQNHRELGYHLGIPGRILELGPEALAELLTEARQGTIWQGGETQK